MDGEYLIKDSSGATLNVPSTFVGALQLVSVEYISIRSGVSISLSYRRKDSSIWVTWNQDNVSEWGDMAIRELLFQ